jgi:hypothetical protein
MDYPQNPAIPPRQRGASPADRSRRLFALGGVAALTLALAGCSTNGAARTSAQDERRCTELRPSGSRAKRIVRVPCDSPDAE